MIHPAIENFTNKNEFERKTTNYIQQTKKYNNECWKPVWVRLNNKYKNDHDHDDDEDGDNNNDDDDGGDETHSSPFLYRIF